MTTTSHLLFHLTYDNWNYLQTMIRHISNRWCHD